MYLHKLCRANVWGVTRKARQAMTNDKDVRHGAISPYNEYRVVKAPKRDAKPARGNKGAKKLVQRVVSGVLDPNMLPHYATSHLAVLQDAEVEGVRGNTAREHRANPAPKPQQSLPSDHLNDSLPGNSLRALAHALHISLEGVDRIHDRVLRDPRDRARHHVVQKVALRRVPVFPVGRVSHDEQLQVQQGWMMTCPCSDLRAFQLAPPWFVLS